MAAARLFEEVWKSIDERVGANSVRELLTKSRFDLFC